MSENDLRASTLRLIALAAARIDEAQERVNRTKGASLGGSRGQPEGHATPTTTGRTAKDVAQTESNLDVREATRPDVAEHLGHTSLRMTKRYAPFQAEKLRAAAERL